ncbi:AraC family transcriptional regulator [Paenibacillus glycanilyticus]|uniref:helix-turn-helix domain-containing protein n=1 Tax=Paenibacillus glycanilyticus TaxID=126569 RepID=UPI00203D9C94|nr:helix-turn-helix domain-containing protein [Paenibacillus glycanilyticus]MCM3630646.1 AraC family transcriptional regulator [Paenibacillus glycanilyticus]
MISISGDAHGWQEYGIENKEQFLAVNWCGYQKLLTKSLSRSRDQGRVDYQLIYITQGKGTFHIGHETMEVASGNLVIYTPGQPQYYSYNAEDGTEAYWIHFTGHDAHRYLQQFGLLKQSVHTVGIMDEVIALFKKIIQELNSHMPLALPLTAAYLFEMLTLVGRRLQAADEPGTPGRHPDINHMIAFIHEKYSESLSIADLAGECSLSVFRFIHKFKEVTGMTPMKYITEIRMNEAKKLLSESSLHVKEVAAVVGYDNPLYFSRIFRSTVGIPPSEYKKQFH